MEKVLAAAAITSAATTTAEFEGVIDNQIYLTRKVAAALEGLNPNRTCLNSATGKAQAIKRKPPKPGISCASAQPRPLT